mgnify:CR=1 FL=1
MQAGVGEIAQRIIHKAMLRHAALAGEGGGGDAHPEMGSIAQAVGAGVPGVGRAFVDDFQPGRAEGRVQGGLQRRCLGHRHHHDHTTGRLRRPLGVGAALPLLTIMPEQAELLAVLLVPTRAYGFVQPGQQARLRFDAFPYQRFGSYQGQVIKTAQAIVLPNEVDMPVAVQEPVYRVEVQLESQQIRAFNNNVPLQSGMLLSADIVLEQRSLMAWLFEPILSLKGRL